MEYPGHMLSVPKAAAGAYSHIFQMLPADQAERRRSAAGSGCTKGHETPLPDNPSGPVGVTGQVGVGR
jgi:hypothetical protein